MRFSREIPDTSNELDSITVDEEDFNELMQAIQQLGELDKTIILLYLEDCSYKDIADITGISVSNVGVRINRAKKELKIILNEMGYEE